MSRKILVVEDNPDVRRGIAIRLKVSGYDAVTAGDGISAVAMVQREKPDLILLDLGLPGGDGFMVLSRVRSMSPDLPVIVITGRDPAANRTRSLQAGARAFLEKPVDNEQLLGAINGLLEQAPDNAAVRARILVVEDDSDIRRGLCIRLSVNGYETVPASDAISAVSTAQKEKPDLVLLDLGLPGGDGFVVIDRLRSVAPHVPVIVLTARDPMQNRRRALDAGAVAFLQKPAENEELLSAIRTALGGQAAPAA